MSAKWIIKKSWEISQLQLPLMEMVIDEWLNAVESQKMISKIYLFSFINTIREPMHMKQNIRICL